MVWCIIGGWGEIIQIKKTREYPIVVAHGYSGKLHSYTFDGKYATTDMYPTLFWDEVNIVPPPKPPKNVLNVKVGKYRVTLDKKGGVMAYEDMIPLSYATDELVPTLAHEFENFVGK